MKHLHLSPLFSASPIILVLTKFSQSAYTPVTTPVTRCVITYRRWQDSCHRHIFPSPNADEVLKLSQ